MSVGALEDGAVCEVLDFDKDGDVLLAESPVSAMAAAFIYGMSRGEPPALAAAVYGTSGTGRCDVGRLRGEFAAAKGIEVGDVIWAEDGDEAGRWASGRMEARGAKVRKARADGEDATDEWLRILGGAEAEAV